MLQRHSITGGSMPDGPHHHGLDGLEAGGAHIVLVHQQRHQHSLRHLQAIPMLAFKKCAGL